MAGTPRSRLRPQRTASSPPGPFGPDSGLAHVDFPWIVGTFLPSARAAAFRRGHHDLERPRALRPGLRAIVGATPGRAGDGLQSRAAPGGGGRLGRAAASPVPRGLVRAPHKYSPSNLDWFVLYQFAGLSSPQIVKRIARQDPNIDESTVLKGVKAAAKLAGWDCLRPAPRRNNRKIVYLCGRRI